MAECVADTAYTSLPGEAAPTSTDARPTVAPDLGIRDLWYLLHDAADRLDDLDQEATARSNAVSTGTDTERG